ncbi:PIG-L family deacetylase [Streptomyces sp. NBC_00536]|uniref:PIG-L family deacetylase n=1 Tax=Streptomyces sp. NBC_00536 TaxID=2975769 RepID=UPI002E7FD438|nr:PIG-L family deacetylase [Streptomyces sp. NBC_00536]WUC78726.1 PIG-L family deacetylase [Streptomyces sp. NBC_00536]
MHAPDPHAAVPPIPGRDPGSGGGRAPQRTHRAHPTHRTRRSRHGRAVAALAVAAAVVAGGFALARGGEAIGRFSGPAGASGASPDVLPDPVDPGSVLQIVAHPDDDLYFMNPDLRHSIATGHPVTTAYLTSGEADGINGDADGPAGPGKATPPPADKAAYAEARQNGIRAAYAQMATGNRDSAWKRTVVTTAAGGHAEQDVLIAEPSVQLLWLQLREAGNVYADRPDSLHGLWDGRVAHLESMLASGSPVRQGFTYTKDQVVATIEGVLAMYKPTTVRAQDPTPGRYPDDKRYTDHQDHFYGARFVQAALARYAAEVKDRPHFAVQNYLGYINGSLPPVLDPRAAREKLDSLDTYAWLDRTNHCGSAAGCGDLKVAANPAGNHWTESIHYARGDSTSWLTADAHAGLWAFRVLDGQLALWHRDGLLGTWDGPRLLPGTGMDQGVTTTTLPDGRIAAFGTRTSFGTRTAFGDRPQDYRRDVVYAVQKSAGSVEFGPWHSLGTPETADEDWTSDISAPAVAVDRAGRLAVYVRDGAYTLRGRTQGADGSWGPWDRLGGKDLYGNPATATDAAGHRMVFASTASTVLGWAQPEAGAALGPATPTGLPATTLPLTAVAREGGVRLWFRKPDSGDVRTALVTVPTAGTAVTTAPTTAGAAPGGLKVSNVTELGGMRGFGAVTAAGQLVAGRSGTGELGSDVGAGGPWQCSALMFVGSPSSAPTGRNLTSLAVLGLDARLYLSAAADSARARLAPWQPVGPRAPRP